MERDKSSIELSWTLQSLLSWMNRSFPPIKDQTQLSKQIWLASLNSLTATVLITQVPIYNWSSFFSVLGKFGHVFCPANMELYFMLWYAFLWSNIRNYCPPFKGYKLTQTEKYLIINCSYAWIRERRKHVDESNTQFARFKTKKLLQTSPSL